MAQESKRVCVEHAGMAHKQVISTVDAPAAIGPYSQAIKAGDFVFCSGQIGLSPAGTGLVGDGVEEQCRQALENLKAVLEAAGSDLSKVVKTTVLLADMAFYPVVNSIYAEYFPTAPPARAAYAALGLPAGAKVEIEAIALTSRL